MSQLTQFSRGRLSEAQGGNNRSSQEQTENLVKLIVNLSINKYPFKRPDLVKHALNGDNKAFPQVWLQTIEYLNDVYGLKVLEVADCKSIKQYFTVSILPAASHLEFSNEERKRTSLLYILLGIIFMKNGSMTEAAIWEFLKLLGIRDNEVHDYFGDVNKSLTEVLPKQLYLKRVKVTVEGLNEEKATYSWGQRAEHEIEKKTILESIAKLLNKPSMCFIQQHGTAYPNGVEAECEEDNVMPTQAVDMMEVDEEEQEAIPSTSSGRRRRR